MNERRDRAKDTFWRKFPIASLKQFFPSRSVQRMLKLGDALVVRVMKQNIRDAENHCCTQREVDNGRHGLQRE